MNEILTLIIGMIGGFFMGIAYAIYQHRKHFECEMK
jgi:hypothetical protein